MNTSIIINTRDTAGKALQKTITYVNPDATNSDLKALAQKLTNISTNSYVGASRINKIDLDESDGESDDESDDESDGESDPSDGESDPSVKLTPTLTFYSAPDSGYGTITYNGDGTLSVSGSNTLHYDGDRTVSTDLVIPYGLEISDTTDSGVLSASEGSRYKAAQINISVYGKLFELDDIDGPEINPDDGPEIIGP